jgi:hypothetical protein
VAAAVARHTHLDGEQRELVALLEAGTAHVVLIVNDILMHSQLTSGAFAVAREPVELSRAVVEPSWRMMTMQAAQRAKLATLRISRAIAPGVPRVVMGDSTRLMQARRSCVD